MNMNKKGFTMIELLAVILIIALLSGIGVVGVRSFFRTASERYYNIIENNILLAGNDYFEDHRDILPVGSEYADVSLEELISSKYIEQVTDTDGNACTDGTVYAYRENNKFKYDVCINNCGSYSSTGRFCTGVNARTINISSRTASGKAYDVLKSYNLQKYSKGESILVDLSVDSAYNITRYVATNTKNNIAPIECTASNNACEIEVNKTGTYKVIAYDGDKEISSRYFNVKIASSTSDFSLSLKGTQETGRYIINENECNGGATKNVKIAIVKRKNEEYKTVTYQIRKILSDNSETIVKNGEPRSLVIEEALESGSYTIDVIVTNYASDEEQVETINFDVAYLISLEYEDGTQSGTHKVVKDKNYNYISNLPDTKTSYGQNADIRWYKNETRIYSTNIVNENCTYNIVGKTSTPVSIEDFGNYCKDNLKYTENEQTLTEAAPSNVTFVNNTGTAVGSYTVYAHVDTPAYVWNDGTITDKPFTCTIDKADNPLEITDNQVWEPSYSTSAQTTTITAATGGVGTISYAINSQPTGNYFTISGTTLTLKASAPTGVYDIVIRVSATGNSSYAAGYRDINMTISVGQSGLNPIRVTSPQRWDTTYSTSIQNHAFTAATNAQGAVTYSLTEQKNDSNTTVSYFSIPTAGTASVRMAANTPVGTYTVKIQAHAAGNANYPAGNKIITMDVTVANQKCNAPTNVAIGTDGKITWTASSNCPSAQHQVKVASGSYANATSGVDKYSDITSAVGSRKVYVKAIAPANFSDSDATEATTTVNSVALAKGTGVSSVSGAGKYIKGETVSIGATMTDGYSWSKWTNTSGGSQVSTSNPYSFTINGYTSYTANASANSYKVTYIDNLFAAQTQIKDDVTITYTEDGSYLTLNGSPSGSSSFLPTLWSNEKRSFTAGDKYQISIKYISGTLNVDDEYSNPSLLVDLSTNGSLFSDRATTPKSYFSTPLPKSGTNKSGVFTVNASRASADGFRYRIWHEKASAISFDNYKVQIILTKIHDMDVTYNSNYGTLDTTTKTGYKFNGWYTAITGGTKKTDSTKYSTVGDQTLYAQYTSHKLYVQLNGNGSDVTWCSTSSLYSMDQNKYALKSSDKTIHSVGYGQYINSSDGFSNYNNSSYVCFAKSGYTAVPDAQWVLSTDSSKKYDHKDATYTAIGVANDAGCNLETSETCTIQLNVNWKSANPITVTTPQTWNTTYSTSAQTKTITAASSAQGTVTYAIKSQKKGSTTVTNFSLSGRTLTMAASTETGSYTVVITATAAGNDNYIAGSKDITVNITVGVAEPTCPTVTNTTATYDAACHKVSVSGGVGGTIKYEKSINGGSTYSDQGTTNPCRVSAGTTYVRVRIEGDTNYSDKTCDTKTIVINKAANPMTVTTPQTWETTYSTSAQTYDIIPASNAQGDVTYTIQSQKKGSTTVTKFSLSGTTLTMAKETAIGSYTVVILASAAGNDNYESIEKTITVYVTVSQILATNTVAISGTANVGNTLTATITTNSSGAKGYQWYYNASNSTSGGTAIDGATNSTYTISADYLNKYIYVEASVGSSTNFTTPANSKAKTAQVGKGTPTVSVSVTGTTTWDQTLTCSPSNTGNGTSYTYAWYYTTTSGGTSGTAINGATSSTYKVAKDYVGKYIGCTATVAATTAYNSASAGKATTSTIAKKTGSNSVAISGTNTWGSTLTATITTNSDGTKGYKWYYSSTAGATSGGTAVGATNCNTGSTCVIPSSLVGKYIYVVASVGASDYYTTPSNATDATDATANTTQAVAKKDPTCPTVTGTTAAYDASCHYVTVSGGANGTIKYSKSTNGGSSYIDMDTENPCRQSIGTTYVKVRMEGDTNYNDKTCDTKTIVISKAANPMTVTSTQSWNPKYSTSSQTTTITPASNAQGTVTYAIKSQKKGSTTVTNFSLSGTTLTMTGSTAPGTYTVVINVNAAGNSTYEASSTLTITMTVTVDKADNPISVTTPQTWSTTYKTTSQTKTVTAASNAQGTVTYNVQSQKKGTTTISDVFTISGRTLTMAASTEAGSYTVVVRATAAGNDNYASGYKDITVNVTIGKADPTCPTVTDTTATYDAACHRVSVSGGTGGTIKYEKSIDDGSTYSDQGTTNPCRVSAGMTYVRVRVVGDTNYNDKACDTKTVTINKAAAVNPTLTDTTVQYDGSAHYISVSGGSGGTIKYRTKTSTSPKISWGSWSETKPSLTDIGKIFVQAMVVGDNNHTDTTATDSKTLEITKKQLTDPTPICPKTVTYRSGNISSGISCPTGSTASGNISSGTGAKTQTCTITSTSTTQWSDGTTAPKSFTWYIVNYVEFYKNNGTCMMRYQSGENSITVQINSSCC